VGKRATRLAPGACEAVGGVIVAYLPADGDDEELWHFIHDDGDDEDLSFDEVCQIFRQHDDEDIQNNAITDVSFEQKEEKFQQCTENANLLQEERTAAAAPSRRSSRRSAKLLEGAAGEDGVAAAANDDSDDEHMADVARGGDTGSVVPAARRRDGSRSGALTEAEDWILQAKSQSAQQAVDKENDARRKALHGDEWNSEMDPLGYIGQRVQLCWSIAVAEKNQTLRHLAKTHGCNLEELVSLNMHYW
jgi:hypothetical protein